MSLYLWTGIIKSWCFVVYLLLSILPTSPSLKIIYTQSNRNHFNCRYQFSPSRIHNRRENSFFRIFTKSSSDENKIENTTSKDTQLLGGDSNIDDNSNSNNNLRAKDADIKATISECSSEEGVYSSNSQTEQLLRAQFKEQIEIVSGDDIDNNKDDSLRRIETESFMDSDVFDTLKKKRSYISIVTERLMQSIDDYQLYSTLKKRYSEMPRKFQGI